MNIISGIVQGFSRIIQGLSRRDLPLTSEKAWNRSLWNLIGSRSLSGETVTEETALTYSAVWNAVSLISGTVASLPLHLFREQRKKKVLASEESVSYVLGSKPNPNQTSMSFRETMLGHILTWGNGYAEKVYNGMELAELWPIPPDRVTPEWKNNQLVYRIRVENQDIYFTRDKILHIPGLGYDGLTGYSVVAMARKSIGLGMAMETFGSLFFGSGSHPGLIVTHPGKLKDPGNLRTALKELYTGLGKSHNLMLLEEGMEAKPWAIPNDDSQFLESRQFQIPEIARWFNLPPHKLKDLTRSSFNNIESEQISFVTDSILPWLIRLEQNYNAQLLTENEQRNQGLYWKHNVEGLLRGNAQDRAAFYQKMWAVGAMSINEIRAKEDMDPIPDGDEYFVPANMMPLSKALNPPAIPKSVNPFAAIGDGNGNQSQQEGT